MKTCNNCRYRMYPLLTGTCPHIKYFEGRQFIMMEHRMGCVGAGIHTIKCVGLHKMYPSDDEWQQLFLEYINEVMIPIKEHVQVWPPKPK